ncbi:MAG: hypothetical protein HY549_02955, partial [Elusimicrobia bacterium]|nr:hypothetical protein [Elusimicrobiota bacterium]
TAHAIKQMNKSGAWEFGWYADDGPPPKPWPEGPILDIDSKSAWASRMGAGPAFLFIGAKTGFNDHRQKLSELRMMKVRPDLPARDNVAMIEANWPRKAEFEDDFSSGSLGLDWMVVWGVISGSRNRMAIMPTPKQKSAAVFLTGTEDWRDMVLEFEIKKFRRSVWAHARYDEGRRYIRVGANHGWLHVQQKSSAESPPVTLAKEPLSAASFPARVRLILKDQWAIVYLNGRMRFGKGLPVDLGITHGRLQFSVYHSERWQALGVLNYVRAAPLGENWIAFRVISEHLSDGTYDALHEDAVFAKALSPQWIWIQSDGTIRVKVDEEQEELVRAISGFNRCALAPLTHFGLARLDAMRDPGSADRLYRNLLAKTAEMNLGGLNLRLPNEALERRDIRKFLRRLRAGLKEQNKGLWVTVNSRVEPDRELIDTVDGVLRPVRRAAGGGGELLQGYEPAEPGVTEGGSS